MIDLKDYQEKAIEKLRLETNELLEATEGKICVFKAPTGSGKTLMTAEFLKRLVTNREDKKKLSFIWISVNKLHDQSKNSLERYYEDSRPKAEALTKYIKEQNTKHNKKLWGGIVVPKGDSFRYNDKEKYQFNETNLGEDWEFLSFN